MKVLVFGATGMAGHMIAYYLSEQGLDVTAFARKELPKIKTAVSDIRQIGILENTLSSGFDVVINCVGLLNQYCDEHRSESVWVNSYFPHYLAELCLKHNSKFIHLSTDCVFSGATGAYKENSVRDGNTFYDRTKAMGETDYGQNLVFRQSIIGPDMNPKGIGLLNWFMGQIDEVRGYVNVFWNGVTTLVLAKAIEKAIESNLSGVYHLVSDQPVSKHELLQMFNLHFRKGAIQISPVEAFGVDKSLVNTRTDFDFIVPGYNSQMIELSNWILSHEKLYRHYLRTK